MSSNEVIIMSKLSQVINFVKEQIAIDLKKASNSNMINVKDEELKRIAAITESSIQTS